jgi:hypothetical protein
MGNNSGKDIYTHNCSYILDLETDVTSPNIYERYCNGYPPIFDGCKTGIFYIKSYAYNNGKDQPYTCRAQPTQDAILNYNRISFLTRPLREVLGKNSIGSPALETKHSVDLLGRPRGAEYCHLFNYGFTVGRDSRNWESPIPGELIVKDGNYFYIDASGSHPTKPEDIYIISKGDWECIPLAEIKQRYLQALQSQSRITPLELKVQQPSPKIVQCLAAAKQEWNQYRLTFQGNAPKTLPLLRLTIASQALVVDPANFWPLFLGQDLPADGTVDLLLPPEIAMPAVKLYLTCLYQFRLPTNEELGKVEVSHLIALNSCLPARYLSEFYRELETIQPQGL